ncbi:S41 family peptidase [Cohnella zeiphila]|uniref:S41 family peptidase n=1 Tax=Cohnella zeiphila TaxID=2761120 RepID=A0A7X0SLI6_9BACL|nr:S41 family peptidase [Cohnella zeiphila]MBB6732212.1 S41 family peptidase [Cohnella zeiphila]
MKFRGRTVAAIAVLAAVGASGATLGALALADRLHAPLPASEPAVTEAARSSGETSGVGLSAGELSKLNEAYELIRSRSLTTADPDKLIDGAISGMVSALNDPFSAYYSQEEASGFTDSVQGSFSGIGAKLDLLDGKLIVSKVMKGTPADRAGLKEQDIVLSVNGQSLEGLSLQDAVAKIRGPKGTKAKLRVQRSDVAEPLELELVRDLIAAQTVSGELDDGVGWLKITQFTFDTPQLVEQELASLEKGGMKALVIDVRNNPGGVVASVEEVAELFIPSGRTIVIDEDAEGKRETKMASGMPGKAKTYPLVVLVNGESASAAEILAGALRQSAGATLVGTTTYGKGTVQVSFEQEFGDGSLMKLTVSKWLLPDGTWINGQGIRPDTVVGEPDYYSAVSLPMDRKLSRDETGDDVRNLQLMLEGVGLPADRKDGYFSAATEQSVREFQRGMKLPETGVVDEQTAEKLEAALIEVLRDPDNDAQWQAAKAEALELAGL